MTRRLGASIATVGTAALMNVMVATANPLAEPAIFKFASGLHYAFDSQNGKGLYMKTDSKGNVNYSLTVGGTTYRFSGLDPKLAANFDPCSLIEGGECPLTQDQIDAFKVEAYRAIAPTECQVVTGEDADSPPPTPEQMGNGTVDANGDTEWVVGEDEDGPLRIVQKTGAGGDSFIQFGEEDVVDIVPMTELQVAGFDLFEIPPPCLAVTGDWLPEASPYDPTLVVPAPASPKNRCPAPAPLQWQPHNAEILDYAWTQNGVLWDNNPPIGGHGAVGGYLNVLSSIWVNTVGRTNVIGWFAFKELFAPLFNGQKGTMLDWTAVPTNRLWGTLWCGMGNEFTAYTRKKFKDPGNSDDVRGNACAGETPISEHTNKPISTEDVYKAKHGTIKRNGMADVNLFKLIWAEAGNVPKELKNRESAKQDLADMTNADWLTHELPNANVWDHGTGKPIKLAQRLTRCRAVPNYIDPDFKKYTAGLQVVGARALGSTTGGTKYSVANTVPEVVKRGWDSVGQYSGGFVHEDWCRQHDWAPISYAVGPQGICLSDARAWLLSNERKDFVWEHFPHLLFHEHMVAFPCKTLKINCIGGRNAVGTCRNWGIRWENGYTNKYTASNEEGRRFYGPAARNDMGSLSVCATLRLPGEAVDGTFNAKIGNGVCDCEYNNDFWGYDGGDCCEQTCRHPVSGVKCSKLPSFAGYDCKQPGCLVPGGAGAKIVGTVENGRHDAYNNYGASFILNTGV